MKGGTEWKIWQGERDGVRGEESQRRTGEPENEGMLLAGGVAGRGR